MKTLLFCGVTAVWIGSVAAAPEAHVTPDVLKHPWAQLYYVEPTVVAGQDATVPYYVTDFDHSKVRFGDTTKRFDVTLGISSDGTNFAEQVQRGVPSGDGRFALSSLGRGGYVIRLSCTDADGRVSRPVWSEFRVRTTNELAIAEAQTERPDVAELAKRGIVPDPEAFYSIVPVELPDDVKAPVSFRERMQLKGKKNADKKAALDAALSNAVVTAVASDEGQALVAAHPKGYVVFAPAKKGVFIFRSRDHRVVVPGARHDAAATEARAAATSKGLTAYLAERAAAGVRKVVLPKAVWRLSAKGRVLMPNGLTLDLNGGKLKVNTTKVTKAEPILFFRTQDAHLVNGEIEGCYFEYDYEHCGTTNPEHVGTLMTRGDATDCSVENLTIHDTVGTGVRFGMTFVESLSMRSEAPVRDWVRTNGVVSFAVDKPKKTKKGVKPDVWEKGLLDAQGVVRDGGEGCWTSPVRPLDRLKRKRFLEVCRFLGYRGMSGVSDYFTIAFYDAAGRFVHREVGFQYHRVFIPSGAESMRISIEADSAEKVNASDLKAFMTAHPRNCVWRNVRFVRCRTCGLGVHDGFNLLFDGIDISYSGDESCRCASDAEDGWDGMQNFTYRNVRCHDNPNGDFTVCCGHSFVYEKCDMRWWFWQRVHSPVIRDSIVRGGTFDCLTRTRNGYTRFENNTYDLSKLTLGTADSVIKQKGVTPDWEIVLDGAVIKGKSKESPATVTAHKTGRFRACTFENCEQKGVKENFVK